MTDGSPRKLAFSQPTCEETIREVIDDAHVNLAVDALAEFLLAARHTIETGTAPAETNGATTRPPRGASPATHAYLRPVQLLTHGQARHTLPLSSSSREALLVYIEDVAARPRGAGLITNQVA